MKSEGKHEDEGARDKGDEEERGSGGGGETGWEETLGSEVVEFA